MSTPKLTKKQKKGLAFRERKGKKDVSEEELAVPEADAAEDEELEPPNKKRKRESGENTESAPKLTKKQKKGLAFRDRKGKKDVSEEELAVPEAEDEEPEPPVLASKKRKRESGENTEGPKKRKLEAAAAVRYILFVGNLKYTTSLEAIRDHFQNCDPPPQVRLLTRKTPGNAKSKGCAFLEFSHKNALQQGLKRHGSSLDGRRINVELTAGGGGKSEQRLQKVQARNKQLLEERKTRAQKKGDEADMEMIAPPQRHSTTSGMENIPSNKRTWSVPEDGEQSGAKKRGKKKPAKSWGTGANSIAMG